MAPPPRFKDALDVLARYQVDLVIVGGVAAVLNGAPLATFDLDVVHERSPENIDRLVSALNDLDARYRDPGGLTLRVLGLAALIRSKEEAGRDKDRAVLGLLRETLREREGE